MLSVLKQLWKNELRTSS